MAQRDEKKDVSLTYSNKMPKLKSLETRLTQHLDNIPLPFVKRASRHCLRYMDGYRAGLVGPELVYAIKKYKGHRMIPRENLEIIQSEFKKQQEDKLKATFKSCLKLLF